MSKSFTSSDLNYLIVEQSIEGVTEQDELRNSFVDSLEMDFFKQDNKRAVKTRQPKFLSPKAKLEIDIDF